jgi:hypothetical protein
MALKSAGLAADTPAMESLLYTLALAGGALLGVAVFIACWEQWRQGARPPQPPVPARQRAVSVDVDVDTLSLEPAGDGPERSATLDAALGRMVSGPTDPVRPTVRAWIETRPMVSPSAKVEPETH